MRRDWRTFAPWGLYLAALALLVAFGLYVVQQTWGLPLQISLAVAVIGVAAFALLDPDRLRRALTGRQARYGSNALVLTLAFVGILGVINFLGYEHTRRWDLTEDQEHTLAPETLDTLNALSEPVTALAFFTGRMPIDRAQALLDDFKYFSHGKFDYRFINPDEDPVAARQAKVSRDGMIVLQVGDHQEQVTLVTEREITGALIRLLSPGERVVYFLTGHGEKDPQGMGDQALDQLRSSLETKNYRVEKLNLLATHSIPEDARVIVIAGPTQPVISDEVVLLETFVNRGGGLVVMEEPLPVTDFGDAPDPLADYLRQSWGIDLGADLVVDLSSNQPFTAFANQYGNHLITQKMQGMATFFPGARSVQIGEQITGVSPVALALTASQSWAERDLNALEQGEEVSADESTDLLGPVPLAVAAEKQAQRARVVVFGDSDFASNAWYRAFGNGDLIVNAIDWAAEQEDLINLTPKERTSRRLIPPNGPALNLMIFMVLFILPLAVIGAGIVVWVQRRRGG